MINSFLEKAILPSATSGILTGNELSDAVDENLKQPFHGESENEEEEEDLHSLPIPGPSVTHESGAFLNDLQFENMNRELERHLGEHLETEIEEVFQERMTPEPQ